MEISNFVDPFWTEAAQAVRLELGDSLMAPSEFRQHFESVLPYKASHTFPAEHFASIAIHKGRLDAFEDDFLQRVIKTHQPILANDVFVVLSVYSTPRDSVHPSHYNAFVNDVKAKAIAKMRRTNWGEPEPEPVYFVHLPRTGGTSLRRQLVDGVFKPWDVFPAQQYEELSRWDEFYEPEHGPVTPELLKSYKLFGGHLGGWFVDRVLGTSISAFTMLRDPVEQMVSYYQYFLQSVLPAHQQVIEADPDAFQDLESFVQSPHAPFNQQARVLGYDPGPDPNLLSLAQANLNSLGGIFPPFDEVEDGERLKSAKRRLQSCSVVGVTPRRAEFFQKLKQVYGWTLDSEVNINIADPQKYQSVDLSPHLYNFIQEKQRLDYELYEMAQEMSP